MLISKRTKLSAECNVNFRSLLRLGLRPSIVVTSVLIASLRLCKLCGQAAVQRNIMVLTQINL